MIDYCIKKATNQPFIKRQIRVYAVIVDKRGKIVAEATNSYVKTHPFQKKCAEKANLPEKEYLHAECSALIKSKGLGHKMYVARVDSKGNAVPAIPCPVCQIAICEHGNIKSLEWS